MDSGLDRTGGDCVLRRDSFRYGMYPGEGGDKLREGCGVFGVFCKDPEKDAVPQVYCGLFSLQHRGQES
ncbi:MAG: hypothetical protein LBP27_03450, partial [Treponema sp.]|nr:hypothetical protein [Treponema sp.]